MVEDGDHVRDLQDRVADLKAEVTNTMWLKLRSRIAVSSMLGYWLPQGL